MSQQLQSPIVTRARRKSRASERGVSFTQYVILVGCIAIPALAAYAAAGPKIADNLVKVALSVMGLEE
jgi:hypothetical protein